MNTLTDEDKKKVIIKFGVCVGLLIITIILAFILL